uniref:CR066 protein n=1 Tax=Chlamydomonas reinhardtii TaxID=3055 RepID=Q84X72_CHLRE|nr:CR066 protein [Chlamydomonas reinhardtii]|eukprot:XP_001703465.1 predicted protein [Chlamydomonas reinhardtii]
MLTGSRVLRAADRQTRTCIVTRAQNEPGRRPPPLPQLPRPQVPPPPLPPRGVYNDYPPYVGQPQHHQYQQPATGPFSQPIGPNSSVKPEDSKAESSLLGGFAQAVVAAAFVVGLGIGTWFDSEVVLTPANVSSTEIIDRAVPNADICMANGYSASVLSMNVSDVQPLQRVHQPAAGQGRLRAAPRQRGLAGARAAGDAARRGPVQAAHEHLRLRGRPEERARGGVRVPQRGGREPVPGGAGQQVPHVAATREPAEAAARSGSSRRGGWGGGSGNAVSSVWTAARGTVGGLRRRSRMSASYRLDCRQVVGGMAYFGGGGQPGRRARCWAEGFLWVEVRSTVTSAWPVWAHKRRGGQHCGSGVVDWRV